MTFRDAATYSSAGSRRPLPPREQCVGSGARFKPGTEDGKAVEQCFQFNVRFKLTN